MVMMLLCGLLWSKVTWEERTHVQPITTSIACEFAQFAQRSSLNIASTLGSRRYRQARPLPPVVGHHDGQDCCREYS